MIVRHMQRNSHCSFCGAAFAPEQPWPRTCATCGNTTYLNPLPVAVALVPVDSGVLVVRRAIPPAIGALALPGGFINFGEPWQHACAREVREETGLQIDPASIRDGYTRSAGGHLLVFGVAPRISAAELPPFTPHAEVSELAVLSAPAELAFPLHTAALRDYFAGVFGPA